LRVRHDEQTVISGSRRLAEPVGDDVHGASLRGKGQGTREKERGSNLVVFAAPKMPRKARSTPNRNYATAQLHDVRAFCWTWGSLSVIAMAVYAMMKALSLGSSLVGLLPKSIFFVQ
jgi:hypothetical protein